MAEGQQRGVASKVQTPRQRIYGFVNRRSSLATIGKEPQKGRGRRHVRQVKERFDTRRRRTAFSRVERITSH
jgi:hypothetical protein